MHHITLMTSVSLFAFLLGRFELLIYPPIVNESLVRLLVVFSSFFVCSIDYTLNHRHVSLVQNVSLCTSHFKNINVTNVPQPLVCHVLSRVEIIFSL